MEPNDEVLVVIQAESGEEIALPLAALGEQHQEVVVDSDGITTIVASQKADDDLVAYTTTNGFEVDGETSPGGDSKQMIISSPQPISVAKKIEEPRIKQKRKEKLVCLPLFEDDVTLEFQTIEHNSPPAIEEPKKRPRKEYRTKKRLAALEPQREQNSSPSPTPTTTATPTPNETPVETPTPQHHKPSPPPTPVQPTPERRTRLSNACRVATGKMYKCNDCDFSTERINNIILHMKETCPKIKKERP